MQSLKVWIAAEFDRPSARTPAASRALKAAGPSGNHLQYATMGPSRKLAALRQRATLSVRCPTPKPHRFTCFEAATDERQVRFGGSGCTIVSRAATPSPMPVIAKTRLFRQIGNSIRISMITANHNWEIDVRGNTSDLVHLTQIFAAGEQTFTYDDHSSLYIYKSLRFATCQSSSEVAAIARKDFAIIYGILAFTRNSEQRLIVGAVRKPNVAGTHDIFVEIFEGVQARAEVGVLGVTVTDQQGNIVSQVVLLPQSKRITNLAKADDAVQKVMRLFGASDRGSWVGLYRIFEVVSGDVGGNNSLLADGWGSRKNLDRFKHSANSVDSAGDMARHGSEISKPPSNPMTLEEAVAYVNFLVQAWLASKGI